jgi:hypothetical protein
MKIYSVIEYRNEFYPEKAVKSIWRRVINGNIPSHHKAMKVGHTIIIVTGMCERCEKAINK